MAKQAKLKAVLSLDDIAFARGIRHAITLSKDLGKQFAKQPIQTSFVAGALAARKGVQVLASGVEMFGNAAMKAFRVARTGALAAGIAIALISVKSIGVAAHFETIETSFRVFLGTAQKAQDRMKELVAFSSRTPFQLPQVAEASKTLEVLTKGMLSTGKGLELVGNVASGTNRDFNETAITVGRLFSALRSGTHPGEALASLQDSGAISPEGRRKIEGMAGVDGASAWKLAQKELSRFDGMMKQQSATWEGMMSTFHDSILTALAAFGKPLIENLKPALSELTETVFAIAPKLESAGTVFGEGLKTGINVVKEAFADPASIVDPLVNALKFGFLTAGNLLYMGVKTAIELLPAIGGTLVGVFAGAAVEIGGHLIKAFQGPIAFLIAGIQKANAMIEQQIAQMTVAVALATGAKLSPENAMNLAMKAASSGGTVGQRQKEVSADMGQLGDDQIASGKGILKDATQLFFDSVAKTLKGVAYEDVLGAGAVGGLALAGIKKAAEAGAQIHAPKSRMSGYATRPQDNLFFGPSSLQTGGLRSSGLTGTGSAFAGGFFKNSATGPMGPFLPGQGPYQPGQMGRGALSMSASRTVNSLLSIGERRRSAQAIRAAAIGEQYLKTGHFTAGGALGAVRSGDRRAAMAYVRDKQREKLGLEKTNELLGNLERKFDAAWLNGGGGG